jgi:exodeoxyribonuclease V alpha subunit
MTVTASCPHQPGAARILEAGRELITPGLEELAAAERIARGEVPLADDNVLAVYLVPFHRAERSLATGWPACCTPSRTGWRRSAGGLGQGACLAAPAGQAARRLAELTGHDAAAVHRLLQLQPGCEAKYDRDNPLDADLVVVDESSMIDLILAGKLARAVARGACCWPVTWTSFPQPAPGRCCATCSPPRN